LNEMRIATNTGRSDHSTYNHVTAASPKA
jgi:hypothetical protein